MGRARRNWTPEEDNLLRKAVDNARSQSRPLLWRELAKSVPGRSNKDCRRRWWNSLAGGTTRGAWSEEEDARLIEAVHKCGTNWSQTAQVVGSRNPDQCSSHWSQVLDPGINHCDWTAEEDEQLLHSVLSHGTNWATIASSHSPKRTTLALKNRYSTLRLKHENRARARGSTIVRRLGSPLTGFEGRLEDPLEIGNPICSATERTANGTARIEKDLEQKLEVGSLKGVERANDGHDIGPLQPLHAVDIGNGPSEDENSTTKRKSWANPAQTSIPSPPHPFLHATVPLTPAEEWSITAADHSQYETVFPPGPLNQFGDGSSFLGAIQEPAGPNRPPPLYSTTCGSSGSVASMMPSPSSIADDVNGMGMRHSYLAVTPNATPTSTPDPNVVNIPYRVSISMLCTTGQLDSVMSLIANFGTCVTMKIDPNT